LGYIGLIFLTAYCALYLFLWLIVLRWIFPPTENASLPRRLIYLLGLAGAWGLLEWIRSAFLTGFGWLPLSASQESNPVLLSLCAWVGPYGLSVLLVLINLGFASWIFRLKVTTQSNLSTVKPLGWLSRLTPELYICLTPLAFGFLACGESLVSRADWTRFNAGIIQTDFDPNSKWDAARLHDHIEKIESLTLAASEPNSKGEKPDFILWPEAALPISLASQPYVNLLTRLAEQS
jgi:apolipoprotein N-acyltransferase